MSTNESEKLQSEPQQQFHFFRRLSRASIVKDDNIIQQANRNNAHIGIHFLKE